jgi:hypothetical protein
LRIFCIGLTGGRQYFPSHFLMGENIFPQFLMNGITLVYIYTGFPTKIELPNSFLVISPHLNIYYMQVPSIKLKEIQSTSYIQHLTFKFKKDSWTFVKGLSTSYLVMLLEQKLLLLLTKKIKVLKFSYFLICSTYLKSFFWVKIFIFLLLSMKRDSILSIFWDLRATSFSLEAITVSCNLAFIFLQSHFFQAHPMPLLNLNLIGPSGAVQTVSSKAP